VDAIDVLDIPPLPADVPQQSEEPSVGVPSPGLPEVDATAPPMAAGHRRRVRVGWPWDRTRAAPPASTLLLAAALAASAPGRSAKSAAARSIARG
jgi:hypothetical protein